MKLPHTIFLLLCGFYLLTLSGHTYSADEETMIAVTEGLLLRGDVAVVVAADAPVAALRPGVDAARYSPYGLLPSLLALPLYALGHALGGDAGEQAFVVRFLITTLNAPITAATAALLARWALRLGAARTWASGLALLYGLGTFAWPYARTFFSEPLAGLLILIAAERAWSADLYAKQQHPQALLAALLSGIAAGLLLPTRIAAGVVLPVIFLAIFYGAIRRYHTATTHKLGYLAPSLLHVIGWLPGLAILFWYNNARFGTPFASGYASEAGLFTTPLLDGLYGLVLSPGKSVLLFAPPLLLALPGAIHLWRQQQRGVVLLSATLFLSHLLLYACWGEWAGGGVWGPRFLLPVVAIGMLPAAAFGLPDTMPQRQVMRRLMIGAILLIGLLGNLGGVLLNFNTYLNTPGSVDRIYRIEDTPLLAHWRIISERWGRYLAAPPYCALQAGWYASESPEGASLPRRSGAEGTLHCLVESGTPLRFSLDDRRPVGVAASDLRLTLNGHDLGPIPAGQRRSYRLIIEGSTTLTVHATTWNPLQAGFSPRDDALGPQIADLVGTTNSGEIPIVDRAIAPLPERPRPRWAWYYDPANQHLLDWWFWYLPRSEVVGIRMWILGGGVVLVGMVSIRMGWFNRNKRTNQPTRI